GRRVRAPPRSRGEPGEVSSLRDRGGPRRVGAPVRPLAEEGPSPDRDGPGARGAADEDETGAGRGSRATGPGPLIAASYIVRLHHHATIGLTALGPPDAGLPDRGRAPSRSRARPAQGDLARLGRPGGPRRLPRLAEGGPPRELGGGPGPRPDRG